MYINNDIQYIGVNDYTIDLFEGQYPVPNGMSYNSYVILDEKIAVLDTVDARFTEEWLNNLQQTLQDRHPDYLIIQHMEPDHSANLMNFLQVYPEACVVASSKAFSMMKQFFGTELLENRLIVGENDTLLLGRHELQFITAPMVHWPEVIVTYDRTDKVLFSADAFGKFGALTTEEPWEDEARRYYIGIVAKYGVPVQTLLRKASQCDIRTICPLHGPVITDKINSCLTLYTTWASYQPETEGVVIAYTSIYGNTKSAALLLAEKLKAAGNSPVVIYDLARGDMSAAVADAFRYSKLVLASPTYNADIFPFMRAFISKLTERNYSNRTVAFMENGSWAPMAVKVMKSLLEKSNNLSYAENTVKIMSALSEESTRQIEALALELS